MKNKIIWLFVTKYTKFEYQVRNILQLNYGEVNRYSEMEDKTKAIQRAAQVHQFE